MIMFDNIAGLLEEGPGHSSDVVTFGKVVDVVIMSNSPRMCELSIRGLEMSNSIIIMQG